MTSPSLPTIHGITAPPTMAMFSRPEPSPVSCPSSAIPLVKMQGNMMELKSPIDKTDHIATGPLLLTEMTTSSAAMIEQNASTREVLTF